jgi:hypothetical protein
MVTLTCLRCEIFFVVARGTEMVPPFIGPWFPLVLGEKPLSLVR